MMEAAPGPSNETKSKEKPKAADDADAANSYF